MMYIKDLIQELLDNASYTDDVVRVVNKQGTTYDIGSIRVSDTDNFTVELVIDTEEDSERLF